MSRTGLFGALPVFAAAAMLPSAVLAAVEDTETIAFYSFRDGSAGDSAVGVQIVNDADPLKYSGTPTTVDIATAQGGVAFSADRPGRYIFSGQGGTPVMTDPQSLLFTGRLDGNYTEARAGGDVEFASLGSDMSALDGYTVEFFFKIDTNEIAGVDTYYKSRYSRSVKWAAGAWYGYRDYTDAPIQCESGFCLLTHPRSITYCASPETNPKGAVDSVYVNENSGYVSMDNDSEWKADPDRVLTDGKWHHISVVHDKVNHRSRICLDYGLYDNKAFRQGSWRDEWIVETNTTLSVSAPFNLGCYAYRGKIACLRVSKGMLETSEMMYASELETYKPLQLFHWRFEGKSGETVASVPNAAPTFRSVNTNLSYLNSRSIVPAAVSGVGTVIADGYAAAVFTNDVYLGERGWLYDGEELLADKNSSSIFFLPTEYLMKPDSPVDNWRIGAPGVVIPKANYDFELICGHDFTMEAFFRFDGERWLEGEKSTSPRMTVFGAKNDSYNYDWAVSFDSVKAEGLTVKFSFWYKDPETQVMTLVETARKVIAGEAPYDGKWHHYAVTYDESETTFDLYLDGEIFMTKTLPVFAFNGKGQLNLGYGLNNQTACGAFDEVRLTACKLAPSGFLSLKRRPSGLRVIVR